MFAKQFTAAPPTGPAAPAAEQSGMLWSPVVPCRAGISRLEDVLALALRVGRACRGGVTAVSANGDVLDVLSAGGGSSAGRTLRSSPGLAALARLVAQRGKALRIVDAAAMGRERLPPLPFEGPLLAVPLRSQGMLYLGRAVGEPPFDTDDVGPV